MSQSLVSKIFGVPREGPVERRRQKVLSAEEKLRNDEPGGKLSNAETSVLLSVNDSLVTEDVKHAARLLRGQQNLIGAAHQAVRSRRRLQTAVSDARWVNHDGAPASTGAETADDRFRESFDPHRPLIAERTLVIIEVIFVVVEFFFWYQIFSEVVSSTAPWYDAGRIGAVLLAVLLPTSGIIAARVIGGLGHRWVSGYHRIGLKDKLGTVLGVALAGLSVFAIYLLVHDRFDQATRPIGSTQLSAAAMALVFVVVLVGDMMARVFLISEIRKQTVRWTRRLDKLADTATTANEKHAHAWIQLRGETSVQLDRCELIVGTGARIITDFRAGVERSPGPPDLGLRRDPHAGDRPGPMAIPNTAQLAGFNTESLALGPLRCISDAIDTLGKWPPLDEQELGAQLEPMITRLYRLTSGPEPARRGNGTIPGQPPPTDQS